jgi:hypothetical protein
MIRARRRAFAIAALALAAGAPSAPGRADSAPQDNTDSRFSFYRGEGGFLRLDGVTGEVSLCNRRAAGWACQTLPEERTAFETEIMRLQSDNAVLKRELLSHDLPLPAGMRPDAAADRNPPRIGPSEQELNRVVSVIGDMWRRLVEMIASVQKDLLKKS